METNPLCHYVFLIFSLLQRIYCLDLDMLKCGTSSNSPSSSSEPRSVSGHFVTRTRTQVKVGGVDQNWLRTPTKNALTPNYDEDVPEKKNTKPTSLKNLRHRISHNLDPSPKIKFSHRDLDSAVFKLDCYPQSLAPVRRPNFSNPLRQDWWWFKLSPMGYPLINIQKAMETHHFNR